MWIHPANWLKNTLWSCSFIFYFFSFLRLYLCGFIEEFLEQTLSEIQGKGSKGFLEMYFMVQYQGTAFILDVLPQESWDAVG